MAYLVDAIISAPKATITVPPASLTASIASNGAFERTVCNSTPTTENTKVNPRTKKAEFRNVRSLALV